MCNIVNTYTFDNDIKHTCFAKKGFFLSFFIKKNDSLFYAICYLTKPLLFKWLIKYSFYEHDLIYRTVVQIESSNETNVLSKFTPVINKAHSLSTNVSYMYNEVFIKSNYMVFEYIGWTFLAWNWCKYSSLEIFDWKD